MFDRMEAFVRGIGKVACFVLLPAQVAITTFYVLARKLYNFQLTPLQELEWHCFFALVVLTFGMTLLADRHVRIDVAREHFSERTRAIIEIAGFFLALLPFSLAMVYFGADLALKSFLTNEKSPAALGLPYRWIIKSLLPLGGVLLLAAGVVVTARNWRSLKRRPTGSAVPPLRPELTE
jgi:TRAP-type mannitol/chloroaromatic compound transport system permease small subunit